MSTINKGLNSDISLVLTYFVNLYKVVEIKCWKNSELQSSRWSQFPTDQFEVDSFSQPFRKPLSLSLIPSVYFYREVISILFRKAFFQNRQ